MKTVLSLFLSLSLTGFAAAQTEPSKPASEMERLIKMWAGHWATVEQFEPTAEMPQGKQDKGAETMRPGPGGLSLIGDYESHGAFFGHMIVTWIPKEKVYKSYWHDLSQPGVSISTGRWEGDKLVFTSVDESSGTKLEVRDTYSDITATSFTDALETGPPGGPMKKILTIKYTKQATTALAGFGHATLARAHGCEVSKKFELKKPQRISGALKDPVGATASGLQLDLMRDGKVILTRTTDNNGGYDFGEVLPGKYKIRLSSTGFCAPSVKCAESGCVIESILKLRSQTTVVM